MHVHRQDQSSKAKRAERLRCKRGGINRGSLACLLAFVHASTHHESRGMLASTLVGLDERPRSVAPVPADGLLLDYKSWPLQSSPTFRLNTPERRAEHACM